MPDDLTIRDVVAKLRRAAAARGLVAERLRCDVWLKYELPPNTFLLVPIAERGWKGRHLEGFWPYEAQDARN